MERNELLEEIARLKLLVADAYREGYRTGFEKRNRPTNGELAAW